MGEMRGAVTVFAVVIVACGPAAEAPRSSATPAATAAASTATPQTLVGQWVRADSPYVISIEGVSADGKLLARYLNPRPINVSRAEWSEAGGRLTLLVEMRDQLYPGSYYELTYDAASDGLSGVYHQLAAKQDFDVAFYRMGKGRDAAP